MRVVQKSMEAAGRHWMPAILCSCLLGTWVSAASAQPADPPDPPERVCASDKDCPDGSSCSFVCAEIDCPDNEPDCGCSDTGICLSDGGLSPYDQCEQDADCGPSYVCKEELLETCFIPDCPAGNCTPQQKMCEEELHRWCAPAPCASNDDCSEGFACQQEEICSCTGVDGQGAPPFPGDPNDPDIPSNGQQSKAGSADGGVEVTPEPDCMCEPTGDAYCQPQVIECEVDKDCPDQWTCLRVTAVAPCDADHGEDYCGTMESSDEPGFCQPPFGPGPIGMGGGDGASSAREDDENEDTNEDGSTPPTNNNSNLSPPTATGGMSSDDGGCTVNALPRGTSLPWMWTFVIGSLFLALRRRKTSSSRIK